MLRSIVDGIRSAIVKAGVSLDSLRSQHTTARGNVNAAQQSLNDHDAAASARAISGAGDEIGLARDQREREKLQAKVQLWQRQVATLETAIAEAERRDDQNRAQADHDVRSKKAVGRERSADKVHDATVALAKLYVEYMDDSRSAFATFPRTPQSGREYFDVHYVQTAIERVLFGETEGMWRPRSPGMHTPTTARHEPTLGDLVRAENRLLLEEFAPEVSAPPPRAA